MTTPTTVNVRLQLRADTAANWTAANPTLLANEVGLETDTKKLKVGNGSSAWNSLAYFPSIVSGGTVLGNLEIGSTGTLTFEGSTADGFETTLAVTNPTADRTITLPNQSGTVIVSGNASIVDADIAANAEIAVSKLADGAARQLLQTDAAGTGVEWTDNVDIPGTLDVTGAATFDGAVTVAGDLTVNGTTTNINTQNLVVEDKNIILGDVATPSDTTADGGGITLKGATDKTINWVDSTDAWTSSERFSVPLGSASLPSLTFTGDTNTGIYSPGADQVAISSNSSERIRIGANGEIGLGGANYGTSGQVLTSAGSGAAPTWQTPAAGAGDKIQEGNTSAEVIDTGSDGRFVVTTEGSERARVDSSGRLLVGTSSNLAGYNLQVANTSGNGIAAMSYSSTGGDGAYITLYHSKSGTVGTHSTLGVDDDLGIIQFSGSNGTTFWPGASIKAEVDAAISGSEMPGRLVFSTTADGASSPTPRMTIYNGGNVGITGAQAGVNKLYVQNQAGTSTDICLFTDMNAGSNSANAYHHLAITQGVGGWGLTGNGTSTFTSDARKKKNIETTRDGYLEDLCKLRVVKYNWNIQEDGEPKELGIVAQEVEQVFPGLVTESIQMEGDDYKLKTVKGSVIQFMLLKALQEASAKIDALEAKVAALESA